MKSESLLIVCALCSIALVLALPNGYEGYLDVDIETDKALQDTQKLSELVAQWRKALSNVKRRSQSQSQRAASASKSSRSSKISLNKRHCWDVADVCCMWNIC